MANLQEASKSIDPGDLPQLIEWLTQKDDKVRYQAFLLLQHRSAYADDVYPYWDVFQSKLQSASSYQRSIGRILIADNVKYKKSKKQIEAKLQSKIE